MTQAFEQQELRREVTATATPPTLEQVAALAGVSRSTVSRVVNGSPHVTEQAVHAVTEAIAELGYSPNRAARALASKRTNAIALVFPEPTAKVFADPFLAAVTQGITRRLADTDYTLNIVVATEGQPDKSRRFLTGGNVDGALVVSHHSGDHSYAQLGTLPVVFGGRPIDPTVDSTFLDTDNRGGARTAVQHLVDIGRQRIAVISGPLGMPAGADRLAGAKLAAGDRLVGVEFGDFTPGSGAAAMTRLLDAGASPDAVFAANDQMATMAVSVLGSRGLRVPDDVAVVGFDDDDFARSCTPPLTTMRQDAPGLGERMAAAVIDLIEGREPTLGVVGHPELVIRASTVPGA